MGLRAAEECREERGEFGFRHLAGCHRELLVTDLAETGDVAVDADVERRIRKDQVGTLAVKQPGVSFVGAGVPEQEAVRAQNPKIALSRNRRRNERWQSIFGTRLIRLLIGRLVQVNIYLAQLKAGILAIV